MEISRKKEALAEGAADAIGGGLNSNNLREELIALFRTLPNKALKKILEILGKKDTVTPTPVDHVPVEPEVEPENLN